MLGKKLLGLIGFLFLGSQISLVASDVITDCGTISEVIANCGSETIQSYCTAGGILYAVNTQSQHCKLTSNLSNLENGINIIKIEASTISAGDLTNVIASADIGKYNIFACDATSCSQTVGIIKAGDNYYKITGSGNEAITPTEADSCTDSNIGALNKDKNLCLDGNKNSISFSSDTNRYLIEGTNVSSPFATGMVIAVGENYFVQDTTYNKEVYKEFSTGKLIDRRVNFCSGNILNTLQNCVNGVCEKTDNTYNVGTTYLVDLDSTDDLKEVYSCPSTSTGSTCTCLESSTSSPTGVNAFIIDGKYDKTYATLIKSYTTDYSEEQLGVVKMYNCKAGECKETNGLMIYGRENSKNVAECTANGCSLYNPTECTGKTMKITDGNVLCINSDYIKIEDEKEYYVPRGASTSYVKYKRTGDLIGEVPTEEGYYLIGANYQRITKATAPAARKKRTTGDVPETTVMIKCDGSGCTSQDIAAGYYYNAGGENIIKCTGATANSCTLVTADTGYYKSADGSTIIECVNGETKATCSKIEGTLPSCVVVVNESINNVGILTSGNKLCLSYDSTTQKGIQSTDFDTAGYYLADDFLGTETNGKKVIVEVTNDSITIATQKNVVCISSTDLNEIELDGQGQCNSGNFYTCDNGGLCKAGKNITCNLDGNDCTDGKYYLVEEDKTTLITDTTTPGYLYYCSEKTINGEAKVTCTPVTDKGYKIISSTEIYSNNGSENGSKNVTPGSLCDGAETLFKTTKEVDGKNVDILNICLGNGKSAEINANGGRYIIGKNSESTKNIFVLDRDTNKTHALITISATEIKLDTDYKSPVKYVYTDIDSSEVLIRGASETCKPDKILEYDCTDDALCTSKPDSS